MEMTRNTQNYSPEKTTSSLFMQKRRGGSLEINDNQEMLNTRYSKQKKFTQNND